ncbi:MAG: hypothetical protein P4L41_07935 [Flavipsychrobacter sp.]|nr:hypothetical protein [Flavipsychrobacter sp.]
MAKLILIVLFVWLGMNAALAQVKVDQYQEVALTGILKYEPLRPQVIGADTSVPRATYVLHLSPSILLGNVSLDQKAEKVSYYRAGIIHIPSFISIRDQLTALNGSKVEISCVLYTTAADEQAPVVADTVFYIKKL